MTEISFYIYTFLIATFTLLSAFFSGTETALISANNIKLITLGRGNTLAQRALDLLDHRENALVTTLIGNNLANISATAFITFVATKAFLLHESRLLLVTIIQALIFLLLCEIVPKIIARAWAERCLMIFAIPLRFFSVLLRPAEKISVLFSGKLRELLHADSEQSFTASRDEIGILFQIGEREGIIDKNHQDFVSEILIFHEKTASEVMTPTIDIISIEKRKSINHLIKLIEQTRFSRIPVYEDRVDNIIGYTYYRDLLEKPDVQKIEDILYKPYYVPATKKIYELFQEIQTNNLSVVFVVNEFGAVEGLLTPEDIAEEIVGEIQTRDHPKEELITKLHRKKYILNGTLDIEFFQKRFNIDIEKRGFETIAGFIMYMLGRIPHHGDKIIYQKCTFIVEEATDRSVEKVAFIMP